LMDNTYQGKKFTVNLMAEGIQATHQAPWENGWGVIVRYDNTVRGLLAVDGEAAELAVLDAAEFTEAEIAALIEAEGAPIGEDTAIEIVDAVEEVVE